MKHFLPLQILYAFDFTSATEIEVLIIKTKYKVILLKPSVEFILLDLSHSTLESNIDTVNYYYEKNRHYNKYRHILLPKSYIVA